MAEPHLTWLYRLVHSPEWAELQQRFLASMTQRAIEGRWTADQVAAFARDYAGVKQLALWCENEVSRKVGAIDGRARRYKQARLVEGEGQQPTAGGPGH